MLSSVCRTRQHFAFRRGLISVVGPTGREQKKLLSKIVQSRDACFEIQQRASGDYQAITGQTPGGDRFINELRGTAERISRLWSQRGRLSSAQEETVRTHLYQLRTEAKARYKVGAHELNLR
jgi:hypothetical protein